jgi:hypothetical protein
MAGTTALRTGSTVIPTTVLSATTDPLPLKALWPLIWTSPWHKTCTSLEIPLKILHFGIAGTMAQDIILQYSRHYRQAELYYHPCPGAVLPPSYPRVVLPPMRETLPPMIVARVKMSGTRPIYPLIHLPLHGRTIYTTPISYVNDRKYNKIELGLRRSAYVRPSLLDHKSIKLYSRPLLVLDHFP